MIDLNTSKYISDYEQEAFRERRHFHDYDNWRWLVIFNLQLRTLKLQNSQDRLIAKIWLWKYQNEAFIMWIDIYEI